MAKANGHKWHQSTLITNGLDRHFKLDVSVHRQLSGWHLVGELFGHSLLAHVAPPPPILHKNRHRAGPPIGKLRRRSLRCQQMDDLVEHN